MDGICIPAFHLMYENVGNILGAYVYVVVEYRNK